MRNFLALFLCLSVSATVASNPAYACSFSWKRGHSPEDVKRSPKNKQIKGTFKLEKFIGEDADGKELVYDGTGDWPGPMYKARVLGTVTAESGKEWKTNNEPMPEEIGDGGGGCVDYINSQFPVPEADAEGIFWIEAKTTQGRHRIRIWEGQYLPDSDNGETKD